MPNLCHNAPMVSKKNKSPRATDGGSNVALAARLTTGAGKHTPRPRKGTRAMQKGAAIRDAS